MGKNKNYLNCRFLDAGMDGMLCSKEGYSTCKAFHGQKCSYLSEQSKTVKQYTKEEISEIANTLRELVSYAHSTDADYVDCVSVDCLADAVDIIERFALSDKSLIK